MVSNLLIALGLMGVGFASGFGSAIGSLLAKLLIEPKIKRLHKKVSGGLK